MDENPYGTDYSIPVDWILYGRVVCWFAALLAAAAFLGGVATVLVGINHWRDVLWSALISMPLILATAGTLNKGRNRTATACAVFALVFIAIDVFWFKR